MSIFVLKAIIEDYKFNELLNMIFNCRNSDAKVGLKNIKIEKSVVIINL